MKNFSMQFGQGTTGDTYFRFGFCPCKVKVTGLVQEDVHEWYIPMLATPDNIFTEDSSGDRALDGTNGLALVQFHDGPGELPGISGAPTVLEPAEWYKANGIKITSACLAILNGNPYFVEASRMHVPIVRLVHDGGASQVHFQDSSVDLIEAGISGNGTHIVINESNDNYAYVGVISKPSGQSKHCRATTFEDANCTTATAAAAFADNDVIIIIPAMFAQYPLSGIGLMT